MAGVGPAPAYAVAAPERVEQPLVGLELSAPASTSGVQMSSDPSFRGAEWRPYASSLSYELGGPGEHTIYVRFRDASGLTSLAYGAQTSLASGQTLYLPLVMR